jgi:hypothetical protein
MRTLASGATRHPIRGESLDRDLEGETWCAEVSLLVEADIVVDRASAKRAALYDKIFRDCLIRPVAFEEV